VNEAQYRRVVNALKGTPDDVDVTTMKALVEAVTVLQKKVLAQDEQIAQLQAARRTEKGEPS
jgi:hypothetical protein